MTKKLSVLSTTTLLLTFAGAQASLADSGPKKMPEANMAEASMSESSMSETKMTDSAAMQDSKMQDAKMHGDKMQDTMMHDSMKHDSAMMTDVKARAVLIYADWCGSCKILDPKIKAVKAMGGVEGADFVVLDYTDKNANNLYAQAKAAGVERAVRDYLNGTVKTGQLLLVDIDDQTVRGKVTRGFEVSEIVDTIEAAVAAS